MYFHLTTARLHQLCHGSALFNTPLAECFINIIYNWHFYQKCWIYGLTKHTIPFIVRYMHINLFKRFSYFFQKHTEYKSWLQNSKKMLGLQSLCTLSLTIPTSPKWCLYNTEYKEIFMRDLRVPTNVCMFYH